MFRARDNLVHRSHTVNLNAAQARKRTILDKDYTLQGVRALRRVGGVWEYLCVWEDFGPDGDTWEPFDQPIFPYQVAIRPIIPGARPLCHYPMP